MSSVTITSELAIAAGQIAAQHPDDAITIEWRDDAPENVWRVSTESETFWVDDETGKVL